MIVKIFASPTNYTLDTLYKKDANEFLIGVEKGAVYALENGLNLSLAVGDFDSVSDEEKTYIETHAERTIGHPVKKDKTDSDLAITMALEMDPALIIVYGGIGKRLDHTYGNILFLKRGNIIFMNDYAKMFMVEPGTYGIVHDHDYISFFAVEPVQDLTLKGFAFPLEGYNLDVNDPLCISNQGSGIVSFTSGKLLVIQASD